MSVAKTSVVWAIDCMRVIDYIYLPACDLSGLRYLAAGFFFHMTKSCPHLDIFCKTMRRAVVRVASLLKKRQSVRKEKGKKQRKEKKEKEQI